MIWVVGVEGGLEGVGGNARIRRARVNFYFIFERGVLWYPLLVQNWYGHYQGTRICRRRQTTNDKKDKRRLQMQRAAPFQQSVPNHGFYRRLDPT